MDFLIIIALLTILSIIQSVIGVGLLVIGTPTLILLGHSFQETLGIVLPASICISFLQIMDSNTSSKYFRKEFNFFCLPFVLIGLTITLWFMTNIDLGLLVGIMLILSGVIRLSKPLEFKLSKVILKYSKFYQIIMGIIHGLTNMGGGLLTLLSSSVHRNDKVATRAGVAYGYFITGIIQYSTLLIFNPKLIRPHIIAYISIAILSYLLLGKRLFAVTQKKIFSKLITGIVLFYGIVLIFK